MSTIVAIDNDDPLIPKDIAAWRAWLDENEETSDGVWLLVAKNTTEPILLVVADTLQEALCSGWDRWTTPRPQRNNIPAAVQSTAQGLSMARRELTVRGSVD